MKRSRKIYVVKFTSGDYLRFTEDGPDHHPERLLASRCISKNRAFYLASRFGGHVMSFKVKVKNGT